MTQMMIPLLFACVAFFFFNNPVSQPPQPNDGPGGLTYQCDSVIFQDYADEPDGYWLFEPTMPKPDSAHLIVFVHGYGGYNPMIYGAWIKHLVRKGNIVVYPRYQKNILSPHPNKFAENTAKAIKDALIEMDTGNHVKPILSNLTLVGHSYGGVVVADLAINYEEFEIPKPEVALLCAPGSGKFNGGRLESYDEMPEDLDLLIVAHEDDWVVGDEFAVKVFEEAIATKRRNLIMQFADDHGQPNVEANHNQPYSIDMVFDTGTRNYTSKKALRVATIDPVDYNGYWKLLDAMLACNRSNQFCDYAFGGTEKQASLGSWSDGTPIRSFEVKQPEQSALQAD